jgi:hypothetical protein
MKTFTTIVETLGSPNRNGRTYTKEVMQRVIDSNYNKLGLFGMPTSTIISLEKVSHKIDNLRIVDRDLLCDVTILETPMGKILSSLSSNVDVQYRLVGAGDVDENGVVSNYTMNYISAVNE